jgi:hypothetical protein
VGCVWCIGGCDGFIEEAGLEKSIVAAGGAVDFGGFGHAAEEADGVVGEVGVAGDFEGCERAGIFLEELEDGLALY